jgi:hypothetical protein
LHQRINRKLAAKGQTLRKTRARWQHNLGDYYVVDLSRNFIVEKVRNLEALGREVGALEPWESLADED